MFSDRHSVLLYKDNTGIADLVLLANINPTAPETESAPTLAVVSRTKGLAEVPPMVTRKERYIDQITQVKKNGVGSWLRITTSNNLSVELSDTAKLAILKNGRPVLTAASKITLDDTVFMYNHVSNESLFSRVQKIETKNYAAKMTTIDTADSHAFYLHCGSPNLFLVSAR